MNSVDSSSFNFFTKLSNIRRAIGEEETEGERKERERREETSDKRNTSTDQSVLSESEWKNKNETVKKVHSKEYETI